MAVTSRDLRSPRRPLISLQSGSVSLPMYVLTIVLALLAVYVLLSSVVSWGEVKLDDLRYGRPRISHTSGFVGHGEENGMPTQFVAMNLDRQVMVLEIPGGDPNQVRAIPGPYLFGAGEDLTPVTVDLRDMNGDAASDLIVQVKDEEMVYMNRNGAFELITPEERQQIISQAGQ